MINNTISKKELIERLNQIQEALIKNANKDGNFSNECYTLGWISSITQKALKCDNAYNIK